MARPPLPDWVQQAFIAPNVSELTIKLGMIAEPEHLQWQLEMHNPVDGTLLDLQAKPYFGSEHLERALLDLIWLAEEMIARNYGRGSLIGQACTLRERLRALGVPPPRTAEPFP